MIKINLDGECNLKINNIEIKGTLQHIKDNYPQDFFNVIRKYEDYINLSKYNEFEIDVRLNNTSLVTLYFPKDINKETSDITLRYDTAKTESQLNQVNIDKQTKTEILSSYKKLTKKLSDLGYKLYYFRNDNGSTEIEFLISKETKIIPIEVKAKKGRTLSLDKILSLNEIPYGYKFSANNIGIIDKKITMPVYMAMFLK